MSLVVFDSLSLGFGQKTIVADLNLRLGASDRIGLIGPNGSGKTSLLRMLAGQQGWDAGSLRFARGVRVGYLAQDLVVEGGQTLANFVVNSVPGRAELEAQLVETEAALAEAQAGYEAVMGSGADEAEHERLMEVAERLADVHERIAHFDAHFTEHEALRILAGLGFVASDATRDLGEFSGGW